jgi:glycosyltransferase involved in cell wall biosynthesis
MKVLHVSEAYGGGVLAVVNQLANGQVAAGHDVTIALSVRPEAPDNWRELLKAPVKTIVVPLVREISLRADVLALSRLIRLFRTERPDVIHLHSSKAGFLGRLAARLTGCSSKTFYSPHAFAYLAPQLSPTRKGLYRLLERTGAGLGGLLIACSSDELEEAQRLGIRAVCVNNAIDLPELDAAVAGISHHSDSVVRVVTAGRICAAKRPEFFVAVAEEIKRRGLVCDFVWIGGGDHPPVTDAVRFTGWLPRKEVIRQLKGCADIYAQTSTYEGLPVAVLEAQAMGLPAVVSDAVGNRSAIAHGATGLISDVDSVNEFADNLQCLIERPELRASYGAAARQRVAREFSVDQMLQQYFDNYKNGSSDAEK